MTTKALIIVGFIGIVTFFLSDWLCDKFIAHVKRKRAEKKKNDIIPVEELMKNIKE